jgi:hypothetical protein
MDYNIKIVLRTSMPKTKGTKGNTFAALELLIPDTSEKNEIIEIRKDMKSANEALAAANAEKSTLEKAKKAAAAAAKKPTRQLDEAQQKEVVRQKSHPFLNVC